MTALYHWTPESRLPSVMRHGLLPGMPVSTSLGGPARPCVFLAETPEAAWLLSVHLNGPSGKWVCLEVDSPGARAGTGEWTASEPVPPSALRVVARREAPSHFRGKHRFRRPAQEPYPPDLSRPTEVWPGVHLAGSRWPIDLRVVLDVAVCREDERTHGPLHAAVTRSLDVTNEELLADRHRPALVQAALDLAAARSAVVRCHWGVERSALVAALALTRRGSTPAAAVARLRALRGPRVLEESRGDFMAWLEASNLQGEPTC